MTSVLACKLGNRYGISWDAQKYLDAILKTVSKDRWTYYLDNVLPNDDIVLYKLTENAMAERWIEIVAEYNLHRLDAELKKDVKDILQFSTQNNIRQLKVLANRMLN